MDERSHNEHLRKNPRKNLIALIDGTDGGT